jgi:hypothetical protein
MKKLLLVLVISLVLLGVAGCAANPNELANVPNDEGEIAGFWQGLWHGFISPFTFLISLFSKTVSIYEIHNNGGWYNFGFIVGASAIFGGGGRGAARRRK